MTARVSISVLLVLLIGILSGCSSSGSTVANNDPGRTICRNDPDTGSRLPKRVCKTALEWEQIAAKNLEDRRNLPRAQPSGGAASESGPSQ